VTPSICFKWLLLFIYLIRLRFIFINLFLFVSVLAIPNLFLIVKVLSLDLIFSTQAFYLFSIDFIFALPLIFQALIIAI